MAGWGNHMGIDTYAQEEQMNCGMASLAMVIYWAKGDKLNTRILAHQSKLVGGSGYYRPALADDKTMHKVMLGGKERKGAGAGHGNLKKVLAEYGIEARILAPDHKIGEEVFCYQKDTLQKALLGATPTTPVIVGLSEPPHFVVCRGKNPNSRRNVFVIVDPADGKVYDLAHVADSKIIFSKYDTLVDILIVVSSVKKSGSMVKLDLIAAGGIRRR